MAKRATTPARKHLTLSGKPVGTKRVGEFRASVDKIVALLTEKRLTVTQEGITAKVVHDPRTNEIVRVNLPVIPDDADEMLLDAIKGFLDHEVGHVLFTDWGALHKSTWLKKPDGTLDEAKHNLWNMIEDPFVEREMTRRFPGTAINIRNTFDFMAKVEDKEALNTALATNNFAGIVSSLIVPLMRHYAGQRFATEYLDSIPNAWDMLKPLTDLLSPFESRLTSTASTSDCLRLAEDIHNAMKSPPSSCSSGDEGEESDNSEDGKPQKQKKDDKKKDDKKDKKEAQPDKEADKDESEGDENPEDSKDKENKKEDGKKKKDKKPKPEKEEADTDEGEDAEDSNDESSDEEGDQSDDADADEGDKSDEGDEEGDGEDGDDDNDSDDDGEDGETEDGETEDGDADEGDEEGDDNEGDEEDGDSDGGDGDSEEGDADDGDAAGSESDEGGGDEGEPGEFDPEGEEHDVDLTTSDDLLQGLSDADIDKLANVISVMLKEGMENDSYIPYSTDDKWEDVEIDDSYRGRIDSLVSNVENSTRTSIGQMQGHMRRMFAQQANVFNYGGQRSGRIHSAALHRLAVGDPRVFTQREEFEALDTAVTLLIDCSGSMSGPKLATACESAFLLSQTLERLGIAHAIRGFSTWDNWTSEETAQIWDEQAKLGREFSRISRIVMYRFKNFEERFNSQVKRRLIGTGNRMSSVSLAANVDGESVLMAARELAARKEPRKILIVLSDGYPAAAGNGRDLNKHLRFAVKYTEQSGIETIGIGIKDTAVQQFYPKNIVINNLSELPPAVVGQLKRILIDNKKITHA